MRVYDFSLCQDEGVLRKALSGAKVDALEGIASTYPEIQLRDGKKRLTKPEMIEGIVRIYFPKGEPESEGSQAEPAEGAEVSSYWRARLLSYLPQYRAKDITSYNKWGITCEYAVAMTYACHSAGDVRICLDAAPAKV